jgi:hypothetical protein
MRSTPWSTARTPLLSIPGASPQIAARGASAWMLAPIVPAQSRIVAQSRTSLAGLPWRGLAGNAAIILCAKLNRDGSYLPPNISTAIGVNQG